jgi:hypothetical protein
MGLRAAACRWNWITAAHTKQTVCVDFRALANMARQGLVFSQAIALA